MRTPKKVKDKMEGNIQERVLVHSGFYSKFDRTGACLSFLAFYYSFASLSSSFSIALTKTLLLFSEYLFDNKFVDGQQRYDDICNDVEPLLEEGYSLYITGHRYVDLRVPNTTYVYFDIFY
jgi:hypothetical protein